MVRGAWRTVWSVPWRELAPLAHWFCFGPWSMVWSSDGGVSFLSSRTNVEEAAIRLQMQKLLKGRRQAWGRTLSKRLRIQSSLARGLRRNSLQKKFIMNQQRLNKRPAARMLKKSAVVKLKSRTGASRSAHDLRPAPAPKTHPGTDILIQPQQVVDYLYCAAALARDVLNRISPGHWFAQWGTAVGCLRDKGMIAWDFDVDITVVVEDGAPWSGWGLLREAAERDGHQLIITDDRHGKLAPKYPCVRNLHQEYYYRLAERSKKDGSRLTLHQLNHRARIAREGGEYVRRIGRNVVDIALAIPGRGKSKYDLPDIKGTYPKADLLPTRWVKFGPIKLPVAREAEKFLSMEYGADWKTCCRFKKPHGGWALVPASVPRVAIPSSKVRMTYRM